jgi:hypothetical protein
LELLADQPSNVECLIEAGELALHTAGDLRLARQYFGEAARDADGAGDAKLLGRAALGLGGLWVHEHRAAVDVAHARSWQQRALAGLDPTTTLAARLRIRMAAEAE